MIKFENLEIAENVNLGELTTMKLGGNAKFLAKIKTESDILLALEFAKGQKLTTFVLSGGSNTLVKDDGFSGLVLKNELLGVRKIEETDDFAVFELAAGENWDDFCRNVVRKGFSGCEAMVMIPGLAGALPVQNVGAYGQEVADFFVSCRAVNLKTGEFKEFSKEDCEFGYRTSVFREKLFGEFFITSIKIKLSKKYQPKNIYSGVVKFFEEKGLQAENASAEEIMNAVIAIRSEKLPDPAEIPSAGSFFKNLEVSKELAADFKAKFPDAPIFEGEKTCKIPTGWLIDKAGLRGKDFFGMRTHPKNALVLTNISAKSYQDLALARAEIQQKVKEKFGFEIKQEPLEI